MRSFGKQLNVIMLREVGGSVTFVVTWDRTINQATDFVLNVTRTNNFEERATVITDVNVQALADYIVEGEKLRKQVIELLAVIEQCEKALGRNKSKFEMVGWKPCGCPSHWDRHACGISDAIFDCTQALAAIKQVKEGK